MGAVHTIRRAWITTGGTGAQNYDEFADEAEITGIIAANPRSALAIEMPHRAPDGAGRGFTAALPDAVARLAEAKSAGAYRPAEQVVVAYRISAGGSADPAPPDRAGAVTTVPPAATPAPPDGPGVSYGLFCMVDTAEISTGVDQPGLVIRNEDVFAEKVRERVALAEATGHLLSPVLLLRDEPRLRAALAEACRGEPAATDVDNAGRRHEIWPVPAGPAADRLLALAGGGELVVADGNHRTLAAQTGGLPRFLAVITTPESVTIDPYQRLISELPPEASVPAGTPVEWPEAADASPGTSDAAPDAAGGSPDEHRYLPPPGTVHLYRRGRLEALRLTPDPAASPVDNMDHALVERHLLRDALRLEPGDKRVTYVGGDYPTSWLRGEVDAGRAELAILIAPVSVADFLAVNLAREKMPRKSTWFTPKARAGLVLAEIG